MREGGREGNFRVGYGRGKVPCGRPVALLAPDAGIEKLAEGFRWSEGPVWRAQEADLIFSDVPANIAYRWSEGDGTVTLLHCDLAWPNGIALSPDEKTLYVANSGNEQAFLTAFDLRPDGTVGQARVFFDASPLRAAGRLGSMDGLKVDIRGNIWATGPGGVLILSPAGKHLGTILTGMPTANCCFGGADGSTLYITANNLLLRVATRTRGDGL